MREDKVALIVGGTSGVGVNIVEAFVKAGYRVAFSFHNSVEKASNIEKQHNNCKGYKADVTSEKDIASLKNAIQVEFGRLDALVYVSGIFEDSLVENMSLESWNHVMSTNLGGAFLCAKHMLELLRQSGQGRFICIGSVMGESGIYGSCSYAASKAGLIGLVKSIALENAKYGVTANVASFGYIDTGMTSQLPEKVLESAKKKIPMKRLGDPSDVAKVVVDLCEEHANYISGQVIRMNGLLYV